MPIRPIPDVMLTMPDQGPALRPDETTESGNTLLFKLE